MNKLNQQLEDKKKGCGTKFRYFREVDFGLNGIAQCPVDTRCGLDNDLCPICQAEIAILEQAIAILEQAIAEIKNIKSQREMKKDDRGTDMQISPNSVVDKTLLSNPADISNLLQKQRQEILDREVKMQCLICGDSLQREILDKRIHIHFCKRCRLQQLNTQTEKKDGLR